MRGPSSATGRLVAAAAEGGTAQSNLRTTMRRGRFSVSTVGFDPYLQGIGSDPQGSLSYTGLVVPATATTSSQGRYLFQLARASFQNGDRVRLVGFKQYVDLAATYQVLDGDTTVFTLPVTSPLWRFPDGNISWHVMIVPPGFRDTRSTTDTDSVVFRDNKGGGSALLYETLGPYTPPNAGRPYGRPLPGCDLGNVHDLRYPWRDSQSERELNIPIPTPGDVVVYASVWQTAGYLANGFASQLTAQQAAALGPEDHFAVYFSGTEGIVTPAQYNRIAAQLTFESEEQP